MAQEPTPAKTDERDGGATDICGEAKVRFERAKELLSTGRAQAVADTKFVLADSDNKWQWPEDIALSRTADKSPCLTVNITAQHCNQIINNIRQNRPQCSVKPADSEADKKTAEILGGLLRNIQVSSNADVAHDTAAEHAIYGGEGYWRVLTEFESPTSFKQCIVIREIENPQLVYVDPFCGMNRLNAQWGFVFEDITKEACKRDYGIEPASWAADGAKGWVTEHTVRIADYFYCTNVPDTLYMLPDGSSVLESEALAQIGKEGVAQIKAQAKALALQTGGKTERKTSTPKWKYCKLIGGHDKPVDETDWPGQYLPIISVIGKEVNVNGEIVRKGVVRDLKDPARMVNYSFSAAVETIALQNKIPYIAAAEAIEGYETEWERANQSKASVLHFNAFDESGQPIPRPERQQPAMMATAQVQMLQLSTEQMRAASGQQNANFGIRSEAVSGVGIQRLKVQGETATFHFPDNLARALHDEAVVVMDLIPKVMDTRQIVRILGIDGKESQAVLDPDHPSAYGELNDDDIKAIFNPTVGRYDVVIDTGPSYQTQRQEAAAALTELSSKNPQLMAVAGDIIMKSYDFPFSEQLAERLKKTLPPNLLDEDKNAKIPPQAQAQISHLTQHTQELGDALNNASQQLDQAHAEAQAKESEMLTEKARRITAEIDLREAKSMIALDKAEQAVMARLRAASEQADKSDDKGGSAVAQYEAETGRIIAISDATKDGVQLTTDAQGNMQAVPLVKPPEQPTPDALINGNLQARELELRDRELAIKERESHANLNRPQPPADSIAPQA
jgi:hypothetical protein